VKLRIPTQLALPSGPTLFLKPGPQPQPDPGSPLPSGGIQEDLTFTAPKRKGYGSGEVAFAVKMEGKRHLKLLNLPVYNGRAWLAGPEEQGDPDLPAELQPYDLFIHDLQTDRLAVFGASRIVKKPTSARVIPLKDGTAKQRGINPGEEYSIEAFIPGRAPALNRLGSFHSGKSLLPPQLHDGKVARLARALASGASTTYEVVERLEKWVRDQHEYSTDVVVLATRRPKSGLTTLTSSTLPTSVLYRSPSLPGLSIVTLRPSFVTSSR
jgi:hypothetical protein